MLTIGVDFHKRTSTFHVLDSRGEKITSHKIENSHENIVQFLEGLPQEKKCIAMEASRGWSLLHDTVRSHVDMFYLGHPKKMEAITASETKNDNHDAAMIAKLTYMGFLPQAHVSSLDMRELRSLVRFRGFLVNQRRSIRNQVHILIDRNLWPTQKPTAFKDLFCKRGLAWLKEVELPARERVILNECLLVFKDLSKKIQELEGYLNTQTVFLPGLEYLKTVPGFRKGGINSYTILVEISDLERFKKAKHFAHYAGLVPSEHSSGDKHRTGGLVKGANMHLRTAFLESSLCAIRSDPGLRVYYQQVKDRRGSGPAIVATARKLSYAVYSVLKEKRSYRLEVIQKNPPAAACRP